MKPTLIIFAKAPRLGAVKTRLARDIGAAAAWSFHRRTLALMLRRLARDRRWRCWLAITPDKYAKARRIWPLPALKLPQGSGDLGARLDRALRLPPPGPVVIIGTDAPSVKPSHIAKAFKELSRHGAVFGPAEDGGFWLVGMKRRPHAPYIFHDVRWSTGNALEDVLKNFPASISTFMLETIIDVDDGASYDKWRKSQPSL